MSTPLFLPGDLEKVTFSATSTDGSYPLANLDDYDPDTYWQSGATTANQMLKEDVGSAIACDCAVIHNHNFGSVVADIGIKLQVSSVSDFSSDVTDIEDDLASLAASDPIVLSFASVTKRYRRIYFESAAPLAVAPKVGQFFMDQKLDPAHSFELPFKEKDEAFSTSSGRAITGKYRSSQIHKGILRWQIRFMRMNATFETAWLRFHQKVRGRGCPFYYQDQNGAVWYNVLGDDANDVERFRYQLNNMGIIKMESVKAHQNPLT